MGEDHSRRFYRTFHNDNLIPYRVVLDTSDLYILSNRECSDIAAAKLQIIRLEIEDQIRRVPEFQTSLSPVEIEATSSPIIKDMIEASNPTATGPMAAVAGAISEHVGRHLLKYNDEVIVENGGDIWLSISSDRKIEIYTDNIYFKNRLALKIKKGQSPCGICTSSSKLGHSLNFGKADSVTVIADTGALADAAATEICNRIKTEDDLEEAVAFGDSINGIKGILAIYRDKIAAIGEIELTEP